MSAPTPHTAPDTHTREAWMEKAIAVYFRPMFEQLGYTVPETVHVSVGWGYGRAGMETKHIAGNCWSGTASADSFPHVFVSPMISDPIEVLAVLAHELAHATLDPIMNHGKEFRTLVELIGLTGRMTATTPDVSTAAEYVLMCEPGGDLGPYPHSPLSVLELPVNAPADAPVPQMVGGTAPRRVSASAPKQAARWVRVICPDHVSGGVVRTARSTVERGAGPLCGEPVGDAAVPCGNRMILPE